MFRFSGFRENFKLGFNFLYIYTSSSAENREEKFEPVGRLCLPCVPLAYSLYQSIPEKQADQNYAYKYSQFQSLSSNAEECQKWL